MRNREHIGLRFNLLGGDVLSGVSDEQHCGKRCREAKRVQLILQKPAKNKRGCY
jgi:hypothetical protein